MKKIYYTNGINEKRFNSDDIIPEGWKKGRLKSTITTAGKVWYTNGIDNLFLWPTDLIPNGYYKGRTVDPKQGKKQSKTLKSKKYKHYNNSKVEIFIAENEIIPDGFVLGRLPMSNEQKLKLSKSHIGKKHTKETKEKISKHSNNNRVKAKITIVEKYGSLEKFYAYITSESEKTKRKNNTFNTTIPEKEYYKALCEQYGEHNIETNYKSNVYLYRCDFYIKSIDKYIELNFHWTHGFQPYDENSLECQEQLKKWQEKAKTSKYYENAIYTWTVRDVEKLKCFIDNNLNYEIIY